MDSSETETIFRVTAPRFCAGGVIRGGYVRQAAPILRWMVGRGMEAIRSRCKLERWKLELMVRSKLA
jgi:hypothetical protein